MFALGGCKSPPFFLTKYLTGVLPLKLITLDQFRQYTNYYEDDPSGLLTTYIEAAERVVIDYLGYDPTMNEYDEYFSGIGDYKLYLHAQPIEFVNIIEKDGEEMDMFDIQWKGPYVYDINRKKVFEAGQDNFHVTYSAGYRDIPEIIQLSVLRIAALMLEEQGGNIGVTSKSFGDNSRTFINYSNYLKYLQPLDPLRIIRFN